MNNWPSRKPLPPIAPEDRGATLTHAEIGKRLNLSRARVGQIEVMALKKLRKLAEQRGLKLEDLFVRRGEV